MSMLFGGMPHISTPAPPPPTPLPPDPTAMAQQQAETDILNRERAAAALASGRESTILTGDLPAVKGGASPTGRTLLGT